MGRSRQIILKERITRSFRGGLYQLLHAPRATYTGFLLTQRAEGLSARVLLILRLPLTSFRMVPISSLLHWAPGKQKDLPNTFPGRSTAQTGLVSVEDELDIALLVGENA